jgi:carbon storage regulator
MLVLSRKAGDEIVIDGRIRITISALKRDRVRVGITAPPEVQVDRAEVHQKRHQWAEADPEAVVF